MAGELIALTALELAVTDRYGAKVRRRNGSIHFADSLRYMVEHDGLTDAKVPQCSSGAAAERSSAS
jgi:hypothetical protein